ncbi:2431_t:CDS:1 [Paraglomus brasilianum]|uniref:2431_t:CDS:1 n=1 Tax=Paraglomus brasilianum TaxID=144538 RepID=A0A9N9AH91_9GLOM|nr:2431_t:CDS:1 [Paraglomus brasilianum]
MKYAFHFTYAEAVSSAASLASTSVAITLAVMGQHNQLASPVGSLVVTVAMFDDIICLVILAIVAQIFSDTADGWKIARPIISSVGAIIVGVGLAFVMPAVIHKVRPFVAARSERFWRELFFDFMLVYGGVFSFLAEYAGSTRLLGAFMAGMSLANVSEASQLWEKRVYGIQRWLIPIFFASIGFIIPIRGLFTPTNFGYGVAYSAVATFAKFIAGFVTSMDDKVAIGLAMVARGEVGLVIVKQAFDIGIMNVNAMSVTCWALILCTIIGAVGSNYTIRRLGRPEVVGESNDNSEKPISEDVVDDGSDPDKDSFGNSITCVESSEMFKAFKQLNDNVKSNETIEIIEDTVIEIEETKESQEAEIISEKITDIDCRVHVEVNDESIT